MAGVNEQKETLKLKVRLPMLAGADGLKIYRDDKSLNGSVETLKLNKKQEAEIEIPANGGVVIVR